VNLAKAIATVGEMDRSARAREVERQRYAHAQTWNNNTTLVDANCFGSHKHYLAPSADHAPEKRRRGDIQ
jgi:hypothetical protein